MAFESITQTEQRVTNYTAITRQIVEIVNTMKADGHDQDTIRLALQVFGQAVGADSVIPTNVVGRY